MGLQNFMPLMLDNTSTVCWKLRNDERVICLEKTNVRYVTENEVPDKADFASIDVSFISLTKVLEPVLNIMNEKAQTRLSYKASV